MGKRHELLKHFPAAEHWIEKLTRHGREDDDDDEDVTGAGYAKTEDYRMRGRR